MPERNQPRFTSARSLTLRVLSEPERKLGAAAELRGTQLPLGGNTRRY